MATTTRDKLEAAHAHLSKLNNELEAKEAQGQRLSNVEVTALKQAGAKVTALLAEMKGGEVIKDLTGPSGGTFAGRRMDGVNLGDFASSPGNGFTSKTAPAFGPAMSFSEADIKGLHEAVLDRKSVTKAALSSADAPVNYDYTQEVFPFLRDKPRLLDHIPTGTTDSPEVHYFRAVTGAAGATAVAEGAPKPESTPTWETVTATVRKLAHYSKVNDEVIHDFNTFINVIGQEMLGGLIEVETAQLLKGDGTAPNISGLMDDPAIQTIGSAGTDLDAIATAMNQLRTVAFTEPDIVIMHPNDWASTGFALAKDSTGRYLLGNPTDGTKPSLWGVPVLLTMAMTENTAMVANLKEAAKVYVRQAPTLEVHPFGGGADEFIANQTLIRAEERLALTIIRPKAICLITAV